MCSIAGVRVTFKRLLCPLIKRVVKKAGASLELRERENVPNVCLQHATCGRFNWLLYKTLFIRFKRCRDKESKTSRRTRSCCIYPNTCFISVTFNGAKSGYAVYDMHRDAALQGGTKTGKKISSRHFQYLTAVCAYMK